MHVHVGVSSAEKVIPILNALLVKYPHMLALSASSPIWAGVDTGYASNRALMFQQLPTAGLPYHFESWAQYESFIEDQLKSGVITKPGGMHWDIRPSPRWGTIEIRVFDGITNKAELAALVALVHSLVVYYDERLEQGEQLPTLQPWHVKENKWRAARYGLEAEVILDPVCHERLVTDDLNDLLEQLTPTAVRLGCADELAQVAQIPVRGGLLPAATPDRGADRRRPRRRGGFAGGGTAGLIRRPRSRAVHALFTMCRCRSERWSARRRSRRMCRNCSFPSL